MSTEFYTGQEDPKTWLKNFDAFATANNWSDYDKAIIASQLMRGAAQSWCADFCAGITGTLRWSGFKAAFLKKWSISSSRSTSKNKVSPAPSSNKLASGKKENHPTSFSSGVVVLEQLPTYSQPAKQWDFVPKKTGKKPKKNYTNAWSELRRLRQDICVKEYIQQFETLASKCDVVEEIDIVKARMFVTGLTWTLRKKVTDHGYDSYAEARSLCLEYEDSSPVNRDMQIAGLIHRVTETLSKVKIELFARHNVNASDYLKQENYSVSSAEKQNSSSSSSQVVCYSCAEIGHFAAECPNYYY